MRIQFTTDVLVLKTRIDSHGTEVDCSVSYSPGCCADFPEPKARDYVARGLAVVAPEPEPVAEPAAPPAPARKAKG